MIKEFEQLKQSKIKAKEYKHEGEVLDFQGCFNHLIEEFAELVLAVKNGNFDADLANCCEFVFKTVYGW